MAENPNEIQIDNTLKTTTVIVDIETINNLEVVNQPEDELSTVVDIDTDTRNDDDAKVQQSKRWGKGLRAGADSFKGSEMGIEFEVEDRKPFIRKTLALVGFGLLVTTMAVVATLLLPELQIWIRQNSIVITIVAGFFYIVCCYIVACCPHVMIGTCGQVVFGVIVICMTLLVMVSCAHTNPILILMATSFTFFGVTIAYLIALSRFDLTMHMSIIMIIGIVASLFLFVGILVVWLTHIRIIYVIGIGVLIIVLLIYIILDLQLILGGKRYQLSPDMYLFAATILYVDIVLLFMYILEFMRNV